jgi:hypothetical protein
LLSTGFSQNSPFFGVLLVPVLAIDMISGSWTVPISRAFTRFYAPLQLQTPNSWAVKVERTGRYGQRKSYGA